MYWFILCILISHILYKQIKLNRLVYWSALYVLASVHVVDMAGYRVVIIDIATALTLGILMVAVVAL